MFGITDARAAESSSEEDAEKCKTSEKRPSSPGCIQPFAKQPKYDTKTSFSRHNHENTAKLLTDFSEKHAITTTCKLTSLTDKNDIYHSENDRMSSSSIQSDQEKQNLCLLNIELKELHVKLEDINHQLKNKSKKTSSEREWEVEKILGKKEQDGVTLYLIKWKNWSMDYNTWEPVENLANCTTILETFEKAKVQLLEKFKLKVNFYPTTRDVEEFLKEIQHTGELIDCMSVKDEQLYKSLKNFFKQKFVKNSKLERVIKQNILRIMLRDLRKEQLKALQDWEDGMNHITKGKPLIQVENNIDLETPPEDFYYIDDYLPGAGVFIPEDPPIGCECIECNPKAKCCFVEHDGCFPYSISGRIRVPQGTPIYECNKRCRCSINCLNRVVQRGTKAKLCIFRTDNGRGWGVKTLKLIKKGTFVIQYVGEVITNEEAERRGKEYDAAGRTYLFDLDYNETEDQCPYTVDAAIYGNISHFINHSCDPNLAVYGVWINCLDPNLPKLALFATKDIKQNEEITFDYMCQSSKNADKKIMEETIIDTVEFNSIDCQNEMQEKLQVRPETPESDVLSNKVLCKCGASNCRRYLF